MTRDLIHTLFANSGRNRRQTGQSFFQPTCAPAQFYGTNTLIFERFSDQAHPLRRLPDEWLGPGPKSNLRPNRFLNHPAEGRGRSIVRGCRLVQSRRDSLRLFRLIIGLIFLGMGEFFRGRPAPCHIRSAELSGDSLNIFSRHKVIAPPCFR